MADTPELVYTQHLMGLTPQAPTAPPLCQALPNPHSLQNTFVSILILIKNTS